MADRRSKPKPKAVNKQTPKPKAPKAKARKPAKTPGRKKTEYDGK